MLHNNALTFTRGPCLTTCTYCMTTIKHNLPNSLSSLEPNPIIYEMRGCAGKKINHPTLLPMMEWNGRE